RNELRGINTGKEALVKYIDYQKAQNLPGLYLGFTATFASTPIRPRQPNPFISTPENTLNTAVGLTIRQNLNFFQANTQLERVKIELKKMDYLSEAAKDGILLEVNQAYQKAAVAEVKVDKTDEALLTTKQWLRMEQQDYDFGIGEVKDLIDAMKMELELRLKEKESIFEFNTSMAKLNNAAGIPLHLLQQND
ncbi:MAG TPA: TolC family protein, partial [Balneola sp.]|nr:TolC family protein [Balneola sp.]